MSGDNSPDLRKHALTTLLAPAVVALCVAAAAWFLTGGLDDVMRAVVGIVAGALAGTAIALLSAKRIFRPIQDRLVAHDRRFDDRTLEPRLSTTTMDATLATVLGRHEARLAGREQALSTELASKESTAEATEAQARKVVQALSTQTDVQSKVLQQRTERLVYLLQQLTPPLEGARAGIALLDDSPLSEAQAIVTQQVGGALGQLVEILEMCRVNPAQRVSDFALYHQEFTLRDAIGKVLQSYAGEAERKGLEMVYRVAGDVPTQLEGDLVRLKQVTTTLVENATRRAAGGRVSITVGLQPGDARDPSRKRHLLVTVEDNGAVVSEARAAHLFGADIAPPAGQGLADDASLGLAVAKALLVAVDGTAWLESSTVGATQFAFNFMVLKPKRQTVTTLYGRGTIADKSVLVIDDDSANRAVLSEQLTSWGLLPTAVGSAEAALEALRTAARSNQPFDLIVLDQQMPEMSGVEVLRKLRSEPAIAEQSVVMVSSLAELVKPLSADVDAQVSARIAKPVNPADFLAAVTATLRPPRSEPLVAPPTVTSPFSKRAVTVLVAEDNPVNQVFTTRMLQKRGFHVTVANNGADAIDAIDTAATPFDILLFDIQMPVMDGLEATALIRDREAKTGEHVPIIAVTAHAISGERQRCIDAGMDDYIPKPVVEEHLLAAMYFALPAEVQRHVPWRPPERSNGESGQILDEKKVLDFIAGDADFLQSLVELFMKTSPKQMEAISEAIQNNDSKTLQAAAHQLKGSVGNFAADRARKWAHKLEDLGRDGLVHKAHDAYYHLQREVNVLRDSLRAFAARHR